MTEALLGEFSHPLSQKFRGQLFLILKITVTVIPKITVTVIPKITVTVIPKITVAVIPKTTYLGNLIIGGSFKA